MQPAPETADKALKMLEQFSGVVGATVEQLWPQCVSLMMAKGITYLVIAGILATIAGCLACPAYRLCASQPDGEAKAMTAGATLFVMAIAFGLPVFFLLLDGLPMTIAPEGALVMMLLGK